MKRPSIAIVGPGRLGTALAVRLAEVGYSISELVVRGEWVRGEWVRRNSRKRVSARALARRVGARVVPMSTARLTADLIWFCVPDAEVAKAAARLANAAGLENNDWQSKVAFHSSGVLTSDSLAALRRKGAHVASVHPLMTFVRGSIPQLVDVPSSVEGDPQAVRVARNIVRDLGGEVMVLRKKDKIAYHAFATMICPLLVSLLAASEAVASLAGVSGRDARRRMMPIVRQTLENYLKLGPAESFSGPLVRGDAETIRLHLRALWKEPAAKEVYGALAMAALEFLPSRNKRELEKLLREPTSA